MGTTASCDDEWIELKNVSEEVVSLAGWQLLDKNLNIKIIFEALDSIGPGEFYLLERTDDDSVPAVLADKIYSGALNNEEESLRLFDQNCNLIDEAVASPDWPAGNKDEKRTMERSEELSWHTYFDGGENEIFGTPRAENSVPPQTRYVPDDFPTIQAAIDAANSGDTIIVREGTYVEEVKVNKTLAIRSEKGAELTIVQGGGAGDVFAVTADNVEINGFVIKDGISGIKLFSSNNTISNNKINSNNFGVYAGENSQNNKIENNIISSNREKGIYLDYSSNNIITNNVISLNGMGESDQGIFMTSSFSNDISKNEISENANGIFLGGEATKNNIISENNIVLSKQMGIRFSYAMENTITKNNVGLNKRGIHFWCGGKNVIFLNNFIENEENFYWDCGSGSAPSFPNIWNSPEKRDYTFNTQSFTNYLGNHWSDYPGVDEKSGPEQDQPGSDGIGDTPYIGIHQWGTEVDEDNYPLMQPFENY